MGDMDFFNQAMANLDSVNEHVRRLNEDSISKSSNPTPKKEATKMADNDAPYMDYNQYKRIANDQYNDGVIIGAIVGVVISTVFWLLTYAFLI